MIGRVKYLVLSSVLLMLISAVNADEYLHDYGLIELSEKPERIAALNWTQAEFLLSLGITPAGLTTIKGYRYWQSNNPPIPDGVIELGHRAEPSMEELWSLKPDLILGYNWRHGRLYERLEKIAPTALYKQYPDADDSGNYLQRMRDNYLRVAELLNRTEMAEQQLLELDVVLAESRRRIELAGLSGSKVMVGKFVGMGLGLRTFGEGSLAGAIISELGLDNAWVKTLPGRDFSHIDLMQLPFVGSASFLLVGDIKGEARTMTTSAVWQQMPAVQENRVYRTPQLWGYGGPLSARRMVEEFVNQLIGEAG
ncbi:iron-siderophore ABC transporter substrate-binding protein [Parendozoicomonas sp. Alg238-R29]|uniref:iron-siderophore ABC transporter substrate-binding protein n=1 Tax=Parendozoicomonas sp. Alg238-R29 TaxID=2993446 RepID=UPI00248D85F1|nr:iron-siderophore ABC transporter substrate-binding protein [Parendozoicomonas sp. Alg238-R29]